MHRCRAGWHSEGWFTARLIISLAPIQYDANKEERNPGQTQSPFRDFLLYSNFSHSTRSLLFPRPPLPLCIVLHYCRVFLVPACVSVKGPMAFTLALLNLFPFLLLPFHPSAFFLVFFSVTPLSLTVCLLLYLCINLFPLNKKSHIACIWTCLKTIRCHIPSVNNQNILSALTSLRGMALMEYNKGRKA